MAASNPTATIDTRPWWRQLNRYHWFVFTVASLAWMLDCLDQQLFTLAKGPALKALLPVGKDPNEYGGYATSIFVIGWATGGLIFGSVGDRIGRARTLTITVLMYSVCTGLSAASTGWIDFAIYRFITGLGVGGVFGLAVALVADSLPDTARPHALGVLQALSAVGNVTAGLIGVFFGYLQTTGGATGKSGLAPWQWMFLMGALPAFLCVFIQLKLKEPEKWVQARAAGKLSGVRFGSYGALLLDARWRGRALAGMFLCVSGVIGLWGIGFFAPDLIRGVMDHALREEGVPAAKLGGLTTMWAGLNGILQNVGAFAGMLLFTKLAGKYGRKPVFAVGYICAMISTIIVFKFLNHRSDIFWMTPMMGFFQLALFAGYAIYLPELFPVNLRATGTSFCYNVGRFIAASGPFVTGRLTGFFAAGTTNPEQKLEAFRNACVWMSGIFLLGLIVLPFAPETRGRPLPEDDESLKR